MTGEYLSDKEREELRKRQKNIMKGKQTMNDLYEMKLHEVISYDAFEVHRVPGGWVYRFFQVRLSGCIAAPSVDSIFVPMNDEMKESRKVNERVKR